MRPLPLLQRWFTLAMPLAVVLACRVPQTEIAWSPPPARTARTARSEIANCGPNVELDSVMLATGPVYRACRVDREAEPLPLASETLARTFRGECRSGSARLAFVVDASGRILPRTARTMNATHADCARAAVAVLPRYRFSPALLGDHAVHALVDMVFRFDMHGD
jgi:hypothetical protein